MNKSYIYTKMIHTKYQFNRNARSMLIIMNETSYNVTCQNLSVKKKYSKSEIQIKNSRILDRTIQAIVKETRSANFINIGQW